VPTKHSVTAVFKKDDYESNTATFYFSDNINTCAISTSCPVKPGPTVIETHVDLSQIASILNAITNHVSCDSITAVNWLVQKMNSFESSANVNETEGENYKC
jgi:hypothetical protein